MEEVVCIEHKGCKILRVAFEGVLTKEQIASIIEEAKTVIAAQPLDSVRLLTILGETRFDPEIASLFRVYIIHNKPYVKASAVLGVTGLRKTALNSLRYISHRNIMACETEEEAKEYLVTIK